MCAGGAYAYLRDGAFFLNAVEEGAVRLQRPATATGGSLGVLLNVNTSSPGTYTSSSSPQCGDISFTIDLPIPAGVDCPASPPCPQGCQIFGPTFDVKCIPSTPTVVYAATTGSSCTRSTPIPRTVSGAWTLTLSSVTPVAGVSELPEYEVHGTLTAELPASDPTLGAATLNLTF